MTSAILDKNIRAQHPLITPAVLMDELTATQAQAAVVKNGRLAVENILNGQDDRMMLILGPCSIHDTRAALEYARKISQATRHFSDRFLVVLRVYFEKPRTTIGWKGLINDPGLDGSYQINKGLRLARKLLLDVAELGLPVATEFLDTTFGQYYADLISLGAIGARTTESQVHRELASGLSMPVGFKNRTDGNIKVAVDAAFAAGQPHSFPSLTRGGAPAIMETAGNRNCFLILRGGSETGPNYFPSDIAGALEKIQKARLKPAVVIDCSHGNSDKDHSKQAQVAEAVIAQRAAGNFAIKGIMLESHLQPGNQAMTDIENLAYGKSITDACLGFDESVVLLENLAGKLT